jgi:predicted aldo/keto reductase-like oxidoreductase
MDRRNFIKKSALSAAGATILTSVSSQSMGMDESPKLISRTLGKTGLNLPVISMGVMRSDNPNLVKAALKSGIKHLDSAHVYQGGRNEEMLGILLKDYPRDSFIISTKIKGDGLDKETGLYNKDYSVQGFIDKFHTSLQRLQMDHVDILYMHAVSKKDAILFEPYMKVMEQFKKEGKARFLGISTHSNEPESILAAAGSNFYDVVLTSVNFQQEHYKQVKEAIAKAASKGIGIIGMKTMAGGFVDKQRKIPVDAKAALKFVLQDENVHTTIPGFTTFDELETTMSVMQDIELRKEEIEKLDMLKSQGSLYCDGCAKCIKQCYKKLPIPDIMRSYMYSYGYNQQKDAQHLLNTLNLEGNPCGTCNKCLIQCTKNFRIREKINDITRLKNVPSEFLI